jgi:TRAP-type C4-dicarboxylate transport system permease small subunit
MTMSNISIPQATSGWFYVYGRLLEAVVMSLMVILFLEVMVGVVFRMLGNSLSWYDEVASILLAWLTFYGSALASHKRSHISCPEIVDNFPPLLRKATAILAQCLVIIFFALLTWVGFIIMPILAGDSMTSLTSVPMNWVQSVVPISAAMIVTIELRELIRILRTPAHAVNEQVS